MTDYNPHQHLLNIAITAVKNHTSQAAATAEIWAAVEDKPTLLIALFERDRERNLARLVAVAEQLCNPTTVEFKVAAPAAKPAQSQEATRAAMETVATNTAASLLDTFKVNGQSIGDLTPREVEGWANSRRRDARFAQLLIAGLPPTKIIRRFRTAEEAATLYQQAVKEIAA